MSTIHRMLDVEYGPDGDQRLEAWLADGGDPDLRHGPLAETLLHVAVRRRRLGAARALLDAGAAIDARTRGGQSAWTHAARRGFEEVAALLAERGADTRLDPADRLAVLLVSGRLEEASSLLTSNPTAVRTGVPEQDRLLADLAGRNASEPLALLVAAGADLAAAGLDGGQPLHQAAWFGQPANVRLLIDAGAPLDDFANDHESSPLHWGVHGSSYSGGAATRQEAYVALVRALLAAGSRLSYPGAPDDGAYRRRLFADASPAVAALLRQQLGSGPGSRSTSNP